MKAKLVFLPAEVAERRAVVVPVDSLAIL